MRHATSMPLPAETTVARTRRGDWQTVRTLLPYLWGTVTARTVATFRL